jgi:hypothetical protein
MEQRRAQLGDLFNAEEEDEDLRADEPAAEAAVPTSSSPATPTLGADIARPKSPASSPRASGTSSGTAPALISLRNCCAPLLSLFLSP